MIKRKYAKMDIQRNEFYIVKQLVKCFAYQNTTNNLKKWKEDISDLFHSVLYLKPLKKFPTYRQLKRWTIHHLKRDLEDTIHEIIWNLPFDDYPRIYNDYENEEKMAKLITEYYYWLIKEISSSNIGSIEYSVIDKKLDTLILRYENEKVELASM